MNPAVQLYPSPPMAYKPVPPTRSHTFPIPSHRTVHAELPHTALGLSSRQAHEVTTCSMAQRTQPILLIQPSVRELPRAPTPDFVSPHKKLSEPARHVSVHLPVRLGYCPVAEEVLPAYEQPVEMRNHLIHRTLIVRTQIA